MNDRALIPGNREHELIAIVALMHEERIPKTHLASMIDQAGSAVMLLESTYSSAFGDGNTHSLFDLIPAAAREKAAAEVESWKRLPYSVSSVLDPTYPLQLRSIHNRPPLLFVSGDRDAIVRTPGVAIVGTRKASELGIRRARKLAQVFTEARALVVSGLAEGIDTAAHTAVIEAGGATVAVVGTGLTRTYPAENAGLAARIVATGGAIVSQFLPTQHPTKWTFPQRNVTMSGLSIVTVVVEASATSGARLQARVALEHGRTVFLLRSLVDSHEWAAAMVEKGVAGITARILEDPSDLLDRLNPSYELEEFAAP